MTSPACSESTGASLPRRRQPRRRGRAPQPAARAAGLVAALLAAAPALAFEPFVVKDIRVEGVAAHRGRAPSSSTCRSRSASASTTRRPRRRSRRCSRPASSATCGSRYEDGVLIVVVQERPTISRIDVHRQQGIRHRHAEEGAEGHRPRRSAHLRPLRARPRRAGDEAPVHHARPLRRQGHRHRRRRRSATASRSTSRSRKARRRRSPASTSSAPRRSPRSELLQRDAADDARLDHLVHEERPVLASRSSPPTSRRCAASTRTAATSSSTSSRRRCRSRRTRRTSTSRVNITEGPRFTVSDVRLAGDLPVPGGGARGDDPRARRRRLLARAAAGVGARAISDRLGSEGYAFANVNAVPELDREKNAGRLHVLRRPRTPRLRAADQHQRQRAHPRRGDPARDAPARIGVVRRRAHRALEGADQAPRLLRRRQHRDAAGAGHAGPGRRRGDGRPSARPATCSPASATRAPTDSSSTRRCRSRTSSAAATR